MPLYFFPIQNISMKIGSGGETWCEYPSLFTLFEDSVENALFTLARKGSWTRIILIYILRRQEVNNAWRSWSISMYFHSFPPFCHLPVRCYKKYWVNSLDLFLKSNWLTTYCDKLLEMQHSSFATHKSLGLEEYSTQYIKSMLLIYQSYIFF